MRYDGAGETAEVSNDGVVLSRRGISRLNKKDKAIPFTELIGVNYCEVGAFREGYVEFVTRDVQPVAGRWAALRNENCVMFSSRQAEAFEALRRLLDSKLGGDSIPADAPQSATLVPCPACKQRLSPAAVQCPGCGQPLKQGWAVAELAKHARDRKRNRTNMIVGLVVVTLVLAIAMTLLGELYTPPADGPCDKYLGKQTAQGISVYAACEEARRMRGEK